jgi:peptide-methionine (R)-S-oxide reductase
MLKRRHVLAASIGGAAMLAAYRYSLPGAAAADERFKVTHTDAEWRALLTPAQYAVLRRQGTERAYSSPLDKEHRAGTFACAGCQLALFSSETKFDSHTGWPSFWQPLENAAVTSNSDRSVDMMGKEVHCAQCGGHLGHVFNDGPPPTRLRYCMNGVAMVFTPRAA